MKKYFILFLGLGLTFSCSKNSNQKTVSAYISAHNAHNVEKALSFYDSSIVFELKNTWTKSGVEAMKSLEVWDSTLNSNLKLESVKVSADTVFCRIIENNDWFSAVEIQDLVHDPTVFIVKNGKIEKIIAYPSQETGKKIHQAIGSIMQWSQQSQDSTIYELIPNGQFVYSAEAAQKWTDLFSRWKSAQ